MGRSRALGSERPMGTTAYGGKGFKERPCLPFDVNWGGGGQNSIFPTPLRSLFPQLNNMFSVTVIVIKSKGGSPLPYAQTRKINKNKCMFL